LEVSSTYLSDLPCWLMHVKSQPSWGGIDRAVDIVSFVTATSSISSMLLQHLLHVIFSEVERGGIVVDWKWCFLREWC
jgi:hypothetical protein